MSARPYRADVRVEPHPRPLPRVRFNVPGRPRSRPHSRRSRRGLVSPPPSGDAHPLRRASQLPLQAGERERDGALGGAAARRAGGQLRARRCVCHLSVEPATRASQRVGKCEGQATLRWCDFSKEQLF